jgi:hypothetical protein
MWLVGIDIKIGGITEVSSAATIMFRTGIPAVSVTVP